MTIFSRHKLIMTADGCTLLLYVDRQGGEFAEDFFSAIGSKNKEVRKDSLSSIKKYIDENLSGIKIDAVNIMLGSLLVASIAYSSIGTAATALPPSKKIQIKTSPIYTVKLGDSLYKIAKKTGITVAQLKKLNHLAGNTIVPGQQLKLRQTKNTAASAQPKADSKLILVNKKHSLSSAYKPDRLVVPNVSKVSSAKTMLAPDAAKALEALFAKAKQDNIQLTAVSGYRSYERQSAIFASNINKYGSSASANQFSAKAGQSEHQTGLAMDVSSPSVNFTLTQSYADTKEGKWLAANAPQFGFIIRYPKGKEKITGYQFEPWHVRYVGKTAALEISSRNITLEEYLGES
jgi:LAS superfamily LD-carboxypeptidase LdcB